jgi:DtxR family Mn-dependent transcriptional regulator
MVEPDDLRVDDLTPVAQDYIKVIWSATEWDEPPITTKGLASRFSTSPANVSDTVRRLAGQGLVTYEPYRPVTLTEKGGRLAVAMVRRHRLIETFLAEVLGYAWDEVHEEAERLEHATSEDFLARIDRLLGHPQIDPHGDPIPGPDGTWTTLPDVVRLADAPAGHYRVVRVSDASRESLSRLGQHGVVPGAFLEVTADSPPLTMVGGSPVDLPTEDVAAVRVRPIVAHPKPS